MVVPLTLQLGHGVKVLPQLGLPYRIPASADVKKRKRSGDVSKRTSVCSVRLSRSSSRSRNPPLHLAAIQIRISPNDEQSSLLLLTRKPQPRAKAECSLFTTENRTIPRGPCGHMRCPRRPQSSTCPSDVRSVKNSQTCVVSPVSRVCAGPIPQNHLIPTIRPMFVRSGPVRMHMPIPSFARSPYTLQLPLGWFSAIARGLLCRNTFLEHVLLP